MPPPRGTSANIRINLMTPETRLIGLHFCCWWYGSIFVQIFVVGSGVASLWSQGGHRGSGGRKSPPGFRGGAPAEIWGRSWNQIYRQFAAIKCFSICRFVAESVLYLTLRQWSNYRKISVEPNAEGMRVEMPKGCPPPHRRRGPGPGSVTLGRFSPRQKWR